MTTPMQVLASGKTPEQRYPSLGGVSGVEMVAPPARIMGLIAGYPGHAKSDLLWSCPDAFVLNLDKSSIAIPPKATIWPYTSADGEIYASPGVPMKLTWDEVEKKLETLRQLATNNQPRPKMIVFDSISSMIPLLQQWILARSGRTEWKQLDGRQAWGEVYDKIFSTLTSFHSLGYGVWYVAHLVDTKIKKPEDVIEVVTEINLSDKLFEHRLLSQFEFVGVCEKSRQMVSVPDTRFNDPRRTVTEGRDVVTLTDVTKSMTALNRQLKSRVSIKEPIVLPRGNGWSVFSKAYLAAAGISG